MYSVNHFGHLKVGLRGAERVEEKEIEEEIEVEKGHTKKLV